MDYIAIDLMLQLTYALSDIHIKHKNVLSGHNLEFLNDKTGDTQSNQK